MKVVVEVVDAVGLMPKDGHGSANPFVEVEFDGQRQRTQTKFKDLGPAWNETFVFNVSDAAQLVEKTIEVSVYHDKRSGADGSGGHGHSVGHRPNFLGRVRISGASVPLSAGDAVLLRFPLDKRGVFSNVRGDIGLRVYAMPESAEEVGLAADVPLAGPFVAVEEAQTENKEKKKKKKTTKASSSVAPEEPTRVFYSVGVGDTGSAAAAAAAAVPGGGLAYDIAQMKQAMSGSPPVMNMSQAQAQARTAAAAAAQVAPPPGLIQLRPPPLRPGSQYDLVETPPPLASRPGYRSAILGAAGEKIASTYDLVEQMRYLYVNVVKARDLPTMDITGSLDPYVELKLGNYKARTKYLDKNSNPVWQQIFAFSQHNLQATVLEVVVKDKDLLKDDFVGRLAFDLTEVPLRVPPDSPLAPQWYKLEDKKGDKIKNGELLLSVWMGTQADEAFPIAWQSDAHDVSLEGLANTRSKVYFSPKLVYLRVIAIGAQDLVPHDRSRPPVHVLLKAQLGHQILYTRGVAGTINPVWNDELIFVASEPFDEPLVLTVEDRVAANRNEPLARLVLPVLSQAYQRMEHHNKPVEPRWFSLAKPTASVEEAGESEKKKEQHKFSSKIHLHLYLEMGYHVLDESTPYSSDFQPASKVLRPRQSIGVFELGILGAQNLMPMKATDGRFTDAYCVARYGSKWVRTRTVLNSLSPQWHEQYTWEVFDPCTVVTIVVFDNCHWGGHKEGGVRDQRIGKVRIRLSTLETDRVYTHFYPLITLPPSGLRKTGELHLSVRFTCTSWMNMLALYGKPLLPKMHYVQPISLRMMDYLRRQAMIIVAARLGRSEPPLHREVVEYMLDVDSHMFSLRRSKANFNRIMWLLSGVSAAGRWFDAVRSWRNPVTTILVHVLFVILVFYPDLILPTVFLYLFLVGAWNYRFRPRKPPHMDTKLSHAEMAQQDELDEESDTFPSSRHPDVVRNRYDRLRSVAGKVQTVMGDMVTQGERAQALLSWRDPRATTIFILLSLATAVVLYVTPLQVLPVLVGMFLLRHPRFRSRMPSVPFNFFRRLPAKSDMLL